MSDIYDLLIIGGGPAGLTAAIYASRAGLRYLMLDKGYPGGQVANTDMVDNYPGLPGISGIDLAGKLLEHAENMGMELVMDEVTDLDVGDEIKTVHTLGGEYRAHNLLLCTGASPRKLGVPGEEAFRGRGVSYCATCDGAFFRGKKTVVIGGGDTALQDALYLSAFCESVTLVHRRDAFRGNDQLQKKLPQHQNIHLEMSSTALAIEGTDRVSGVRLSTPSGEKLIPADGVFIAVGTIPNSALLRGKADTNEGGYVITDQYRRTSIQGVYAAGDVRDTVLRQILTAAADGAIAVQSMLEL